MKNYFVEYCGRDRIEVEIPTGFFFVEGDVNSGYVIEDSEKNQFLRIPSQMNIHLLISTIQKP